MTRTPETLEPPLYVSTWEKSYGRPFVDVPCNLQRVVNLVIILQRVVEDSTTRCRNLIQSVVRYTVRPQRLSILWKSKRNVYWSCCWCRLAKSHKLLMTNWITTVVLRANCTTSFWHVGRFRTVYFLKILCRLCCIFVLLMIHTDRFVKWITVLLIYSTFLHNKLTANCVLQASPSVR